MVAAVPSTTPCTVRQKPRPSDDVRRPPLAPSERDNATPRRPKGREISSRYLSSLAPPSTPSPSSRRCPSPVAAAARTASPSLDPITPKRSQSADRRRPSTPSRVCTPSVSVDSVKRAPEVLWPSTRSLSVSFQGESFSLPISRRERPPAAARVPSPALPSSTRKSGQTPQRKRHPEISKPVENSRTRVELQHRWPGLSSGRNALTRSLDFTDRLGRDPVARVLQQSVDERRCSLDGRVNPGSSGTAETSDGSVPLDLASDTETVSSSSNSAGREPAGTLCRAICTPARFLQDTQAGRVSRPTGFCALEIKRVKSRPSSAKRSSIDNSVSSLSALSTPRAAASPIRSAGRSSSPSKLGIGSCPPSRGTMSPLRSRTLLTPTLSSVSSISSRSNYSISSILNLSDVRRVKRGANHSEDVHSLRLLYIRQLQWRFANARADASLAMQRMNAEKMLRNAWLSTSELRDSVICGRIKLHQLRQHEKLTAILEEQKAYLEEWAMLDRDHFSSLSGSIEALQASTLRLPIIGGARADVQNVKEAINSAVDVMQTMGSSICHLLSKMFLIKRRTWFPLKPLKKAGWSYAHTAKKETLVEGMNNVVSDLADVAAQESTLLDECEGLLSTLAALQVEEASLRAHLLQLKQVHDASRNMT